VDDEPQNIELLEAYLAPQGYEIVKAASSEAALEKLKEKPVHLVILDIMMPVLDGQKLLEKIRALEKAKGITRLEGVKIIMLTALDGTPTVVGSFKSGCDAYLPKPFEEEDLLREIRDLKLI